MTFEQLSQAHSDKLATLAPESAQPTREQILARFEHGQAPAWMTQNCTGGGSMVCLDRYYQRASIDGVVTLAELEVIVSVLKGEVTV